MLITNKNTIFDFEKIKDSIFLNNLLIYIVSDNRQKNRAKKS